MSQWIEINVLEVSQMAADLQRNNLNWWPSFVREMFAQIGAALDGKPLDPTIVYDIRRHGPIIESRSPMFLPREFAAQRMEEPEGKYFVVIHGKRYGGGRWEFRQAELDLITRATDPRPLQPARRRRAAQAALTQSRAFFSVIQVPPAI
jgi:hypothetical protein